MPAKFTICYSDKPAVEALMYETKGYQLGRAPSCNVVINHPTVSRNHARMLFEESQWSLLDEKSKNGTKINGLTVTSSTLPDDALISIGDLDCLFETQTETQVQALLAHQQWRKQQVQKSFANEMVNEHLSTTLQAQLNNILMLTGMQRGVIFLGSTQTSLSIGASQGMSQRDFNIKDFSGSTGAIIQCLEQEKSVVAMDVMNHDFLKNRQSIELKKISSLACVPLFYHDKVVGVIYTDSKMSDKILTELDMDVLQSMTEQVGMTVQTILLQRSIESLQSDLTSELVKNHDFSNSQLIALCH